MTRPEELSRNLPFLVHMNFMSWSTSDLASQLSPRGPLDLLNTTLESGYELISRLIFFSSLITTDGFTSMMILSMISPLISVVSSSSISSGVVLAGVTARSSLTRRKSSTNINRVED